MTQWLHLYDEVKNTYLSLGIVVQNAQISSNVISIPCYFTTGFLSRLFLWIFFFFFPQKINNVICLELSIHVVTFPKGSHSIFLD